MPSRRFTYGLRGSSILAALLNGLLLHVAIGAIAFEAISRLGSPQPVAGGTVIVVASIGIVINTATALLRSDEHTSDLQSLMRNSYAVFCLKKKKNTTRNSLHYHPQRK